MKRYISLYIAFIKFNIIREMEFRLNFFIRTVVYFLWAGIAYLTVFLIYSQVESIGGWDRQEMLVLTTVAGICNSLYKTFFHQGINRFSEIIRRGDLDMLLTKPANARFIVTMRRFSIEQIPRLVMFIYIILKLVPTVNLSATNMDYIVGFLLIILGSFSLYNMTFAIYCYAFWKPRVWNLFAINIELQILGDKPADIYKGALKTFVFLLPIALFAYVPAMILIGNGSVNLILYAVFITVAFMIISQIIWKFGLRKYESASS